MYQNIFQIRLTYSDNSINCLNVSPRDYNDYALVMMTARGLAMTSGALLVDVYEKQEDGSWSWNSSYTK